MATRIGYCTSLIITFGDGRTYEIGRGDVFMSDEFDSLLEEIQNLDCVDTISERDAPSGVDRWLVELSNGVLLSLIYFRRPLPLIGVSMLRDFPFELCPVCQNGSLAGEPYHYLNRNSVLNLIKDFGGGTSSQKGVAITTQRGVRKLKF